MTYEATALAVKAVEKLVPGVVEPGPRQRYKLPRLEVVKKRMGKLHPGFVRLKVLMAGVCGTDVHLLETDETTGYVKCSAPASIPPEGRILGHECVGEIVEVGEGVVGLRLGDIVSCESVISCGVCVPCRQGDFNQCARARLLGLEEDGVFATYANLPQRICHPIDNLVEKPQGLIQAACFEPAAVAHVALEHARVQDADRVLIFGAGPIGLFLAMLAKHVFGSSHIDHVEPLKLRRELARRWADEVYRPREFWATVVQTKLPYDVVFEASGNLQNVSKIIGYCGSRARVILLARSGTSLKISAVDTIITNAISIIGSRGHLGGAFAKLVKLCSADRLPLHEIVTTEIFGIEALKELLLRPELLPRNHAKVIVHIGDKK